MPRYELSNVNSPGLDLPLLAVLALAGFVTAILLGLALAAFTRRKSRPYLLIALAIATLFARTVVAGLNVMGALPQAHHHLFEHSLDVAMAALVIGAVYYARTVDRQRNRGRNG